jgi:hypothetical protein
MNASECNTGVKSSASLQCALGKVDGFAATVALVGFFKFIGKDFFFFAAFRAFADKRFQALELFISRAMLWCRHDDLPMNCWLRILIKLFVYFQLNS